MDEHYGDGLQALRRENRELRDALEARRLAEENRRLRQELYREGEVGRAQETCDFAETSDRRR